MHVTSLFTRSRISTGAYLVTLSLIAVMLVFSSLGNPLMPVNRISGITPSIASAFAKLPLAFIPTSEGNLASANYEVYGAGNKLSFSPQEITLFLHDATQPLSLSFVGANQMPAIVPIEKLPTKINQYNGQDDQNWRTKIPAFTGIHYQELYPGVDLEYAGRNGSLKSTFTIAPGANPDLIRWQYNGASTLAIDETSGNLLVAMADQSKLVEQAPIAWQNIDGRRLPVSAAFTLAADHSISFALGSYNQALPLIIDPTIVYETTLNLGDFDSGLDIVTDASGNAYVLGQVYDTNNDVLIAKLSPQGALLFATYLRGSKVDFGGGIALDASGDIYVAGGTDSSDFPILNATQAVKNGVTRDAFLTKLGSNDGSLLFSTYFGGSRSDEIHDITLNDSGEIYVVGYTESTDFPTQDPIQSGLNLNQCFCEDVFVTRLSPDAMTVLFSTYLGGSFEDYGQSIALDGNDNIYITGRTQSDDYPTLAAIQPNRAGQYQDEDVFVSKISAGGSLVYSTYLGGTDLDSIRRIAVDTAGNAYLAGTTRSEDFPTTPGAFQETFVGGVLDCGTAGFGGPVNCSDMFVTKISSDGSFLSYSTYLGGGLTDSATGIAVDDAGQAYLVGYTSSSDFPGVNGDGSPNTEIAMVKLSASGSDLLYSLIIDSAVANGSNGIALDNSSTIYITAAQNAPSDLYVAKISESSSLPPTPTSTSLPLTPTYTPASPTPTPFASGSIHVGDLDGGSAWVYRRWFWQAGVRITVHDADHNPVSGATVSGTWSNGYSGTAQCTTGGNGTCLVTTGSIWRSSKMASFSVNNLTYQSFTYTPAANHDPNNDSNGKDITVKRP